MALTLNILKFLLAHCVLADWILIKDKVNSINSKAYKDSSTLVKGEVYKIGKFFHMKRKSNFKI